jgi:branched-chain amino acid transport system substrate-binding protein
MDCNHWPDPRKPKTAELRRAVEAQNRFWLYNVPLNYSAVMLVADALERAGRNDRAALTTALAATDGAFTKHIMPYGPTRFVNGQNQAGAPVNTQVQGGDIKVIFPRDFADAQPVYPVTG